MLRKVSNVLHTILTHLPHRLSRYECEFGYEVDQQGANPTGALSCLPTGEWETAEPECVPVTCNEPPLVAHATREGEERTFLSLVQYQCLPGYVLQGASALECLEDGSWDPEAPRCDPVDCGAPPELENGEVQGSDFTYKSVVTCSCLAGYRLQGRMRRRCNESGLWEGPDPVCQPVDCGVLPDPAHGRLITANTTFPSEASYECDEGYNLGPGDVTRTCLESARWSGEEPVCEPVVCDPVPDIEHGSYQGPAYYTLGARVVYSCRQGYTMEGSSDLLCTVSGRWSNEVPVCRPVECPEPASPQYGTATALGLTFTSKVSRAYR